MTIYGIRFTFNERILPFRGVEDKYLSVRFEKLNNCVFFDFYYTPMETSCVMVGKVLSSIDITRYCNMLEKGRQ